MVLISVNGQLNQSAISVLDRGILFGESVYEVIPIHHGTLFKLEQHIERLQRSFEQICQLPFPKDKVLCWISDYMTHINLSSCFGIYVQLTSGNMAIRNHIKSSQTPNCIIHQTFAESISPLRYAAGFKAISLEDQRSNMANHKTIQLAFNTFALNSAHREGYDDAVFTKDGTIIEAASSNIFAVINNVLVTPPLNGIVPGITREVVLQLAQDNQIPYAIRPIRLSELKHANEVFLTSSIKLLKPLREIKGLYFNKGPFPRWKQLFALFNEYTTRSCTHETHSH
ncbi:MAG: aminotransferase class IV [Pseudomonadota bacterium]|nr:aminotransferase class IV [Pseudomonadota bacterium]